MKQKRRNARIAVSIDAQFRMLSGGGYQPATLVDLGTGGIGLTARMPLYPGDRLHLEFLLGEQSISSACVVSRASGKNFGVVFEDPADPAIEHVQDFIQHEFFRR